MVFFYFFGMALLTPQGSTTGPKGTEYPTQSEDRPTIQIQMDRVKMAPFGFIIFFWIFFCRTPPGQVGGLPTSARVIELTNFKNSPLFITSVGAKFNSLGNSFRHSYLPCATFAHLCNFHFRSLPASCFYYLCTTCVLPGTFTFIHYLPTSLLLHIWPNIFKKLFDQNFWTTFSTTKII